MHFIYIMNADTRAVIASAGFTDAATNGWTWVQRHIAAQFECEPEDVGTVDTDDQLDNITVRGEIVAFLAN